MSTTLTRLARWARDLTPEQVPAPVMRAALLQHLSVAGACRWVADRPIAAALRKAGGGRGAAELVTGGTAPRRDAIRLHAGLSVLLDFDDYLFVGHTGHGTVTAAWAASKGHSLEDLLCATVVGNEIAGRVGAAMLLGPANGQGAAVVSSVGAAAVTGWLDGLDADELAHALALACAVPPVALMSTLLAGGDAKALLAAVPAVQGVDAVELARGGVRGPLDLLDTRDGLLGTLAWVPLRSAFTGLGAAWLTGTLAYKLVPGCAYVQTAVQGVAEVLARHVKAADKRLRADQIEAIEVETTALGWQVDALAARHPGLDPTVVPFSIRRSIGVLSVAHELTPAQLSHGWLDANRDAVSEVARRTTVRHSWQRTSALVEHLVAAAGPLLAGVGHSELRRVARRARDHYDFRPAAPTAREILGLALSRPDRLLDGLRYSSGDLADARLDEWQFLFGADVRLHTIRGGSWPEHRDVPLGSPGCAPGDIESGVLDKYAAGSVEARAVGQRLLSSDRAEDGAAWTGQLLRGGAT